MPQLEKKDIYKIVAEKHNLNIDLISEIGDTVFKAWSDWQRHPDNLRLKIQNIGVQLVRKKKVGEELDKMFASTFDYIDEENNKFTSEEQYMRYLDNKEWYHTMLIMRDLYKEYIKDKQEVRKKRNEVQRPLKDIFQSSVQEKDPKETGSSYFE